MTTTFNYESVTNINAEQLQNEINNSVDFAATAILVNWSEPDSLTIEFNTDLSAPEETALAALVAAHIPEIQLIEVSQLPFSDLEGKKLAVHPSYKPEIAGGTTYAVWCGAGDEVDAKGDLVDDGEIGGGPIIHLDCTTADSTKEVLAKFHPQNGRIWLHEAYIKFTNAPEKSYLSGGIIAMATPLQQLANLDLVIGSMGAISFAPGGPGTGTDGFADPDKIVLVPRTFSHDGDWNYDATNGLVPAAGDGDYKMYNVDTLAHRFVNRIPTFDSSPYFSITSDETTELPKHYYVRVCAKTTDKSNFASDWHASVVLEIYRESTYRNV